MTLSISSLVLEETERNLARKAPEATPYFKLLREILAQQQAVVPEPPRNLIQRAETIVDPKDVPIVAAAVHAAAAYPATYDRRHLVGRATEITAAFGISVVTPDDLLAALRYLGG